MKDDQILYLIALPIILIAVFAEYYYRRNVAKNSLANLSSNLICGLIDRLFFLFFGVVQFESMLWISNFAFIEPITNKLINAFIVLIIVDFVWYLYHRSAHQFGFLWSFHNTHHQTDDFNFSLGLRVSFLQQIVRSFFWLPIPLLGFEPKTILIAIFFQNFYQFFLHTELFDFPQKTRHIFVSPKSHQLHHSNQGEHYNKNFGGVLIIWDKIFGTYKSAYNEESIDLVSSSNYLLLPINAYFSPFLSWISSRLNIKIDKPNNNKSCEVSGNGLFVVFILILIPSLFLIFASSFISFNVILLSSSGLIIIAFLLSHRFAKGTGKS
jgi:sterol desaturase/sphingolipid hydroxylase (fatty acid hydroxylase superfamily)